VVVVAVAAVIVTVVIVAAVVVVVHITTNVSVRSEDARDAEQTSALQKLAVIANTLKMRLKSEKQGGGAP